MISPSHAEPYEGGNMSDEAPLLLHNREEKCPQCKKMKDRKDICDRILIIFPFLLSLLLIYGYFVINETKQERKATEFSMLQKILHRIDHRLHFMNRTLEYAVDRLGKIDHCQENSSFYEERSKCLTKKPLRPYFFYQLYRNIAYLEYDASACIETDQIASDLFLVWTLVYGLQRREENATTKMNETELMKILLFNQLDDLVPDDDDVDWVTDFILLSKIYTETETETETSSATSV